MAIRNAKELDGKKRKVDLRGPDGNAYCVMGIASNLCRHLGKDFKPIQEEMMSGDYENVIAVFDREFGMFVDLYR